MSDCGLAVVHTYFSVASGLGTYGVYIKTIGSIRGAHGRVHIDHPKCVLNKAASSL